MLIVLPRATFRYYGVSSLMVDWTAMSYMAFYSAFVFPMSYVSDRYGLRWTAIVGSGLSCLGAWVKTFSVHPDMFHVAFIGQSISAIAQVILRLENIITNTLSLFSPFVSSYPFAFLSSLSFLVNSLYRSSPSLRCLFDDDQPPCPALDSDSTDTGTRGRAVVPFQRTLDRHVSGYFRNPIGCGVGFSHYAYDREKPWKSEWRRRRSVALVLVDWHRYHGWISPSADM